MQPFEKYLPKRVNKDIAVDSLHDGGDRKYTPGNALDMLNCRVFDSSGRSGVLRSTPGNVLKNFELPTGDNEELGSFLFEKENTIIYFVWNSNNDDRVIEWNPVTDTFTTLLAGDLGFERTHPITQGGTIDDLLLWNDRLNRARRINVIRARAGAYTAPFNQYEISLALRPPLDPPVCELVDDSVAQISFISDDTYQFTHRYVYADNETTVFGSLSKLVWPGVNVDRVTTTKRAITVTVPFPAALEGVVKKIEFAFRTGNNGDYTIFATIQNPTGSSQTVTFRNNENHTVTSEIEEVRVYDNIPDRTEAMGIINSRSFLINNESGFNEHNGASLALTLTGIRVDTLPTKRFLKEGGVYGVAILYEDQFGKTSFAEGAKTVNVPANFLNEAVTIPIAGNLTSTITYGIRKVLDWVLSGTPPAYAVKYQILLSRDRFFDNYFQCTAFPHLYVRETREEEADGKQSNFYYNWKGHLFEKLTRPTVGNVTSADFQGSYKYVYLQIPLNVPFIPDKDCFVRFTSKNWPAGCKKILPIIDVIGDFLVIDLKYTRDDILDPRLREDYAFPWKNFNGTSIEVFKLPDAQDPRFFEVSEKFDVVSGSFSVTSGRLFGDTYNFKEIESQPTLDPVIIEGSDINANTSIDAGRITEVESPSGIVSSTLIQKSVSLTTYKRSFRTSLIGSPGNEVVTEASVLSTVKTFDYFKAASDFGRAHIEFKGAKKNNYFNSISFSDPYIQNTQVNGLSTFQADNSYPVAVERSPTRALLPVGSVMLAIHERKTTSLYIGEGVMKQGEQFVLVRIEGVIADDRQFQESFGTINPESAIVINGHAFWWDAINGAVIRYTNAGLFPISKYGMNSHFRKKAKDYFPYQSTIKVFTGYDPSTEELIITFPRVVVGNVVVVEAETWAFNIPGEFWSTRYSFIAEGYNFVGQEFISFKAGKLWVHNKNTVYNNFYGSQYTRKFKIAANPELNKQKRYLNVHMKGAVCSDQTGEYVPVRMTTPEGQASFIPAYEFKLEQGKWVAPILKDTNTPGIPGEQLALRSGDDIVSNVLEIEVENDRLDDSTISQFNVVYKTEEFSI